MRELDRLAVEAALDERALERLIEENEGLILDCARKVLNRYITKSDDEWSVALGALVQAVRSYDCGKGAFFSFAQTVIRRRLIDYLREQKRWGREVSVDPALFSADSEREEDLAVKIEVGKKISERPDMSLKLEIEAAEKDFSEYGFTFFDLASCSPKAEKTKSACAKAVACIIKNPILLNELKENKQLPIKAIEKCAGVPRKILDRHRKYIIAATMILSGEYPCLAEHMRYIRKELEK